MFRQGCGGKLIIARGPPILVRFVLASVCLSFSWSFFFLVFLFPGLSFSWSFFFLVFLFVGLHFIGQLVAPLYLRPLRQHLALSGTEFSLCSLPL
jgi:hypothetical protein